MLGESLLKYLPILIFGVLAFGFALALVLTTYIRSPKKPDEEKNSAYECGFDAFDDARLSFDVRYSVIALLFIIFDIEIVFLFPWAAYLGDLGWAGFYSMMAFLGILIVGFVYEWKKGTLEWK
jgi:NADH-quinone oxidoreductase subunit A